MGETINKILLIVGVVVAVGGCTISEPSDTIPFGRRNIKFYTDLASEDSDTKTFLNLSHQLRWTADDRLSIFTTTDNLQYVFDGETGDNSGTFSEVDGNEVLSGVSLSRNYAIYPYSKDVSITQNGVISFSFPSVQQYAENSFGPGSNTMAAVTADSEDYFLPFKNLCGYIVVKLYGAGIIKSISLKGNNGEKIAGDATVLPIYGSSPEVNVSSRGEEVITLNCSDGVALGRTSQESTSFWITVPPTLFENGFTITATNELGWQMKKTVTARKEVCRNIIYELTPLEAIFDIREGYVLFEDSNFEKCCVNNFDLDKDGKVSISEADSAEELYCGWRNISSFKGIEFFRNLLSLECGGNYMTKIDLRYNRKLENLDCSCCGKLDTLDISFNINLKRLNCFYCSIGELDTQNNLYLEELSCGGNEIHELDISHNEELQNLQCGQNNLTKLDISQNRKLTFLSCGQNQITNLDFSNASYIKKITCDDNKLTVLDLGSTPLIEGLNCNKNNLTKLDVSNCKHLSEVRCDANLLSELNVFSCPSLKVLYCSMNELTSLDLSSDATLTAVCCNDNKLTALYTNDSPLLQYLYCFNNKLSTINIDNNAQLIVFSCYNNEICKINFDNNISLSSIYCGKNELKSIDVSNVHNLGVLDCVSNDISELDVSKNHNINTLICTGNPALKTIWLLEGQNIDKLTYDTDITTIAYRPYVPVEPVAVDLGLSVRWSSFNLGSTSASDFGDYYAWGETNTKEKYDTTTYKWYNGSMYSLTKYNYDCNYGPVDNKTVLEMEDDVANAKWGDAWRIPTSEEWDELRYNCDISFTRYNGVKGILFSSRKEGYAGTSIFLPGAGLRFEDELSNDGWGYYASSSLAMGCWPPTCIRGACFNSSQWYYGYFGRENGWSIRPVCGK